MLVRMRLLIVGIAVVALGAAGIVIALVDRSDGPSEDCPQVERALRPLARAMASVHQNLPSDVKFDAGDAPDFAAASAVEAQAASDIRAEAQLVQSPDLRAKTNEVADALERISRSRLTPSVPSAPSKDYFAGTNEMNEALHDIKRACPEIGNEPLPPVSG